MENQAFLQKKKYIIFLTLFAITPIPQVLIDMYLPALPGIQEYFKTTASAVQYSLPLYLITYSVSMVVFGIASDIYGRKITFYLSLGISFAGCFISLLSGNVILFLIGRAVQGLGVGACASVILPALMDIFKGEELLHKILMINLAYGIAPIIAPYIGGVILLFSDWHGIFLFIFCYIFALIIMVKFFFWETNLHCSSKLSFTEIFKDSKKVLSSFNYMLLVIIISCPWGFIIIFNIEGPFIFQELYKFTPYQYGVITLFMGSANVLGVFAARFLLKFINVKQLVYTGLYYYLIVSAFFFIFYMFGINPYSAIIFSFLLSGASGIVFGSIVSIAFSVFKTNLGLVSSIFFALTNIIWAGLSYSMSVFKYSEFLLVIMPLVLSILGILLWMLYVKRSAKKKA